MIEIKRNIKMGKNIVEKGGIMEVIKNNGNRDKKSEEGNGRIGGKGDTGE